MKKTNRPAKTAGNTYAYNRGALRGLKRHCAKYSVPFGLFKIIQLASGRWAFVFRPKTDRDAVAQDNAIRLTERLSQAELDRRTGPFKNPRKLKHGHQDTHTPVEEFIDRKYQMRPPINGPTRICVCGHTAWLRPDGSYRCLCGNFRASCPEFGKFTTPSFKKRISRRMTYAMDLRKAVTENSLMMPGFVDFVKGAPAKKLPTAEEVADALWGARHDGSSVLVLNRQQLIKRLRKLLD
jgi:hypothetical protein